MIGIYFSGTGNTRHCVEKFLEEYDTNAKVLSIEDKDIITQLQEHEEIIIGYPVQYSNIPKMVRDFVVCHQNIWQNKKIFVIATMGLFSGDGAGILARLLKKYGAVIVGGLHLKMPDSICDEKVLKRSPEDNNKLVTDAEVKIKTAVQSLKNGTPTQEGLGPLAHLAGLFGQRLYFYHKTKNYSDKLKIDTDKCVGCGKCAELCPMKNIHMAGNAAAAENRCTMCYRCISKCPVQAITLLGKKVVEQCYVEKYF